MKYIIFFLTVLILLEGCFTPSKKTVKTNINIPTPYISVAIAKPKNTVLATRNEKTTISLNNTNIKIALDELLNEVTIDTIIVKNGTVTTYSFKPQINKWDITDTCYSARYFLTIDVRQEITPNTKNILSEKIKLLNDEINAETSKQVEREKKRKYLQTLEKQ